MPHPRLSEQAIQDIAFGDFVLRDGRWFVIFSIGPVSRTPLGVMCRTFNSRRLDAPWLTYGDTVSTHWPADRVCIVMEEAA